MSAVDESGDAALLQAMRNMTEFHREHEKYYSVAPREQAVQLQRHSRTLHALADRWTTAITDTRVALSPYEGASDLNADAALQLDGVLFMEGEGEPVEITKLKRDLTELGADSVAAGDWLANAMASSWLIAENLLDIDGLADLLGERHRIIVNNWEGAGIATLAGRMLGRAAAVLDRVDFTPKGLRADFSGRHVSGQRVRSAAEMVDYAADLLSDFARLVHDNERRWRIVHTRVDMLLRVQDDPSVLQRR